VLLRQAMLEFAPSQTLEAELARAMIVNPHTAMSYSLLRAQAQVIHLTFVAASVWAARRALTQEWNQQYLLIVASTALRTVARETMNLQDRQWFFELASLALKELLGADDFTGPGPKCEDLPFRPTDGRCHGNLQRVRRLAGSGVRGRGLDWRPVREC
jgi:hypothetical protein